MRIRAAYFAMSAVLVLGFAKHPHQFREHSRQVVRPCTACAPVAGGSVFFIGGTTGMPGRHRRPKSWSKVKRDHAVMLTEAGLPMRPVVTSLTWRPQRGRVAVSIHQRSEGSIMDQPHVIGDWAPADNSANHLELALTDHLTKGRNGQEQVIAIRDTFRPDQVMYCTPDQVRKFARSVVTEDSPTGRLLSSASSGTATSTR